MNCGKTSKEPPQQVAIFGYNQRAAAQNMQVKSAVFLRLLASSEPESRETESE
jgi:hypothetical protein